MPPAVAAVAAFFAKAIVVLGFSIKVGTLIKVALVAASLYFSKTQADALKNLSLDAQISGRSQMVRQPITPRRIIFGEIRVSGPLALIETVGSKNKYLYVAILLASHAVAGIDEVYAYDEVLTTSKFNSYVTVDKKTGAAGQAASTLLTESDSWTTDHKLSGIAYLGIKSKFHAETFSNGIPNYGAVVRGALVYDPREASHDVNDPLTWAYSTNPALCAAYLIMDPIIGYDASPSEINWSTVAVAANICDEIVNKVGGGTEKRYTINGEFSSDKAPETNLQSLLTTMGGFAPFVGGQYEIHAAAWTTPTKTLTQDDLRGPLEVTPRTRKVDLVNVVRGAFFNRNLNVADDYPEIRTQSEIDSDGGQEYALDLSLAHTDGASEAQRLARIEYERARRQRVVVFPAKWKGLQFKINSTVYLDLEFQSVLYTNKPFRVIDWIVNLKDGGVDLVLREDDPAIYTWDDTAHSEIVNVTPPNLPNPFSPAAPTSLGLAGRVFVNQDGSVESIIDVSFTPADDGAVFWYDLEYKQVGESNWTPAAPIRAAEDVDSSSQLTNSIYGLKAGVNYDVRVRSRTYLNGISAWVATNQSALADTTPPGVPTSFNIVSRPQSLRLEWINPSDDDFLHTKIYRRIVDSTPSEIHLRATVAGISSGKNLFYDKDASNTGVTYYYWLRSVDTSGNESALTSVAVSASPSNLIADLANDIADSIVDTAKFASGIEPVGLVASLPNPVGYTGPAIVFNTTDLKLYRYDSGLVQWTVSVDGLDISNNSITAGQIAAGAINTSELSADAVTAEKIAASAITASEIAANAIISSKILAGAVSADKIVAGAVTAAKIAADAVTADKLAANSITATNGAIASLAVDTLQLKDGAISDNQSVYSEAYDSAGSTWANTQTKTITVPGGQQYDVVILMSARATPQHLSNAATHYRVLRDGVEIMGGLGGIETIRNSLFVAHQREVLSPGPYLYQLQHRNNFLPFAGGSSYRAISLIAVKK